MQKPQKFKPLRQTGIAQDLVLYYDESSGHGIGLQELIKLKRAKQSAVLFNLSKLGTEFSGLAAPKQFQPKEPEVKNKELVGLLRQNGIQTLSGARVVLIPELNEDEDLPMPRMDREASEIPFFRPLYTRVGADNLLFKKLSEMVVTGAKDELKVVYTEFLKVADSHYFGNGSINGQIGRFKAVKDVADMVKDPWKNRMPEDFVPLNRADYNGGAPKDFDAYWRLMGKRFPLPTRPAWMQIRGTDLIELEALFLGHKDWFVKVQPGSAAGIIWKEGTTREDVIEQDIALAEWLLSKAGTISTAEEFFRAYDWVRLTEMKPKSEVYERLKFLTKTRNIFVTNSFAFMPAHILMAHAHDGILNATDSDEIWSLLGWSPFYGGLYKLLIAAFEAATKNGFWVAAFADNVYVLQLIGDRYVWFSIDGEKMEACITNEDVVFYNTRVLGEFWGGDDSLSQEWINYLVTINPRLVIDSPTVIFNQQLQNNGMGSGSVGTAQYNTAKMIRGINEALPLLIAREPIGIQEGESQLNPKYAKAFMQAGVKVTLERAEDITKIITDTGVYRLDLLGFDATTIEVMGIKITVPTLDRSRLVKALIFNKKHYDKAGLPKLNPYTSALLRLVKYRALYLAGGWTETGINDLLVDSCNDYMSTLGSMEVRGIAGIRDALARLEEDELNELAEAFGSGVKLEGTLGVRAVPTIIEAIRLAVGNDIAEEVAEKMIEDEKTAMQIGHFMPEAMAIELGMNNPLSKVPRDLLLRMVESQIEIGTLIDEGFTQLPELEGKKGIFLGSWADEVEKEEEKIPAVVSQPPKKEKIPKEEPTIDPFRQVAKKTSKAKAQKEKQTSKPADFKAMNMRLSLLLKKFPDRKIQMDRPAYYKDRPSAQIKPDLALRNLVKKLSEDTGVPKKEVHDAIQKMDFEVTFRMTAEEERRDREQQAALQRASAGKGKEKEK